VLQHNTVALQPTSFDSAGATATAVELVCITVGGARTNFGRFQTFPPLFAVTKDRYQLFIHTSGNSDDLYRAGVHFQEETEHQWTSVELRVTAKCKCESHLCCLRMCVRVASLLPANVCASRIFAACESHLCCLRMCVRVASLLHASHIFAACKCLCNSHLCCMRMCVNCIWFQSHLVFAAQFKSKSIDLISKNMSQQPKCDGRCFCLLGLNETTRLCSDRVPMTVGKGTHRKSVPMSKRHQSITEWGGKSTVKCLCLFVLLATSL